ncbi:DsrE family protein [Deferrisoma palaeochoriense]
MDRKQFLAAAGAAGLAGLFGAQAFAGMENKGKYVFVLTHGADDPNRAVFGLLMAQVVAKKKWGSVHVWTTLHGAELAHRDKAPRIESPVFKKFGAALEILEDLRERGATFGVCPPCAEYFGATGEDKLPFFEKAGGDWLMENIQGAWVLWM